MAEHNQIYYFGTDAAKELAAYCSRAGYEHITLVCDPTTYGLLGEQVHTHLLREGYQASCILLDGGEVVADETYLMQVLFQVDAQPRLYLAVGAGTITDITRFCSHRSGNPFVCLPTAPSVDGFASVIAPVVIRKFKDTAYAHPPAAIYADIQTLCAAPRPMIAAGFGDMLGKYTALADWKISHLLTGEAYHPEIAGRMQAALDACVSNAQGVRDATPQGIARLMDGLVESGVCMQLNGNSRPASGAEHHFSHFWEMRLLRQGRPAVLHGAKVGIGTVIMAGRFEQLRALQQSEVDRRLAAARQPDPEQDQAEIQRGYGELAARILDEQRRYREVVVGDFETLKREISRQWEQIRQIAARVPAAERMAGYLEQVGAPTEVSMIGLGQADMEDALRYAHYLRSQFTITRLGIILGLW